MIPENLSTYDLSRAKLLAKEISNLVQHDEIRDIAAALALMTVFIATRAHQDFEGAKNFVGLMHRYQGQLLDQAFGPSRDPQH